MVFRVLFTLLLMGCIYASEVQTLSAVDEANPINSYQTWYRETDKLVNRDRKPCCVSERRSPSVYHGLQPAYAQGTYSGLTGSCYTQLREITGSADQRRSEEVSGKETTSPRTTIKKPRTTKTIKGSKGTEIKRSGWIPPETTKDHDCSCEDCQCPPRVCSRNMCDANYLVVFGSNNCKVCPNAWIVVENLRKKGYVVYYVGDEQHPSAFQDFDLRMWPTFIVFRDGEEIIRFEGLVRSTQITKYLKTRSQQGLKSGK